MMWSTSALVASVLLATVVANFIRPVSASKQSWNPPKGWNEKHFFKMLSKNKKDLIKAYYVLQPELHISFTLYTRQNQTNGLRTSFHHIPATYSANKLTVFIVHGWMSSSNDAWITNMTNALLKQADCNVIVVSWDSIDPIYFPSAFGTLWVGMKIAFLAQSLFNQGLSGTNLYCIGHSLGAHACGSAGNRVLGFKFGRITGLDPARPLFDKDLAKLLPGLSPECADLVDVIHTNAGLWGTNESRGHIDFYPNGGKNQLGCTLLEEIIGCSHSRAINLYTNSITQLKECFLADQKGNTINHCSMGWYADQCPFRGVENRFDLLTGDNEPFCKN